MKIFTKIKICLILVIIDNIQSFLILLKKWICKLKDEFKGKIVSLFVGWKSKLYSLVAVAKIIQKESIKMLWKA